MDARVKDDTRSSPDASPRVIRFRQIFAGIVEHVDPGQDIARRFLDDVRMLPVWETLLSKKVTVAESAIHRRNDLPPIGWLDPRYLCSNLFAGLSESILAYAQPLQEQACIALMLGATAEICLARQAIDQGFIDGKIQGLLDAAELSVILRREFPLSAAEFEILAGAQRVYERITSLVRRVHKGNPHIVTTKRHRGNAETARARHRALAALAHEIYGTYLYQIVATVAAVGLQADPVKLQTVRAWCRDKPQ